MNQKKYDLSIVVPVFNEERSLEPLYQKIKESLNQLGKAYEIIFIDDGSTDNSYSVLRKVYLSDANVVLMRFAQNRGKSEAYSLGFQAANGDLVITMDADLQDDPQDVKKFLKKIEEGYDMVVGWKYSNKGPFIKTVTSRIFNALVGSASGLKIHDINCPFKAYRQSVVRDLKIYGELYRFIPLIAREKGYSIAEVRIENYPRVFGKSKYGPTRFIKGLLDLTTIIFVTKYSQRPLHVFGSIGIFSFISGFFIDAYLTVRGLIIGKIGHTAMLLFGVLLMLLGVQLISMGVIAEFIVSLGKTKGEKLNIDNFLEKR